MGAKMNWVRRVGALMVLAALVAQAGAAVPGQQGAGPAEMPGAKTGGPVYRVVHNNHDIKVLLRKFWDQDLRKPRLFNTDTTNFPWINGCLSSHRIVHFGNGPNSPPSVLKIKLVRIVLRSPDIVSQIARIKPNLGLEEQNIGYLVASVKPVDPTHNRFWKRLYFGQHPKYVAFQIYVRSTNRVRRYNPYLPQFLFRIRINNIDFHGYIDEFDAFYDSSGPAVHALEHRPPLPDAKFYTMIGQSAGLGAYVNLDRDDNPNSPCR